MPKSLFPASSAKKPIPDTMAPQSQQTLRNRIELMSRITRNLARCGAEKVPEPECKQWAAMEDVWLCHCPVVALVNWRLNGGYDGVAQIPHQSQTFSKHGLLLSTLTGQILEVKLPLTEGISITQGDNGSPRVAPTQ